MQPQSLQLISQSEIFLTFGSKRIDYGARKKHEGEDVMSEAWSARKTWELLHGPCSLRTPSTKTWSFISWLCDRYTDDGMVSSKVNKKLIRTIPKSTLSSTKDSITIDLWSVYAMGFSNGLRVHQALLVWLAQQPISLFAMLLVQTAHQVAHIFPPLEGPMNHCLTPSIAFLLFSAQHPSKTACLSSPPPHPSLSLSLSPVNGKEESGNQIRFRAFSSPSVGGMGSKGGVAPPPSVVCCMCGDHGLAQELFRCKVCLVRCQHK